MEEAGLFEIWKRKHWPVDMCKIEEKENMTSAHPMVLRDMRAEFLVLSAGILAATITLMLEFGCAWRKRAKFIPRTVIHYLCMKCRNLLYK